ncbi:hypothetical protein ACFR9T_15970 [Halorubrum laminariae]|uniref:Uncharacterized protein n=1 Tax=Halorubrum laminariae TaxID=1433523 RepID=A0ABD6C3W6_9EURY
MFVTIKLERFPTRICELLVKSNPREDFLEILSRVLSTRFYTEFELWKQHCRRSTANLFRLSCLDHLLTHTAQREEPQLGSATTVQRGEDVKKPATQPLMLRAVPLIHPVLLCLRQAL